MQIEIWEGKNCRLSVPCHCIPQGATLRECYETETQIIVCGYPLSDDESHNCDQMGCSSVNHVLYRFEKGA